MAGTRRRQKTILPKNCTIPACKKSLEHTCRGRSRRIWSCRLSSGVEFQKSGTLFLSLPVRVNTCVMSLYVREHIHPYLHNKPVFREHSKPVCMCVCVRVCVCKRACLCVYVSCVFRCKECVAVEYVYIAVDTTAARTSDAFAHAMQGQKSDLCT